MKRIYLIISLIIFSFSSIEGQNQYSNYITYKDVVAEKSGNMLDIQVTVDYHTLNLNNQEMMIVTPVLKLQNNELFYSFNPIVLSGKTRYKALKRDIALGSYDFGNSLHPSHIIKINEKNRNKELKLDLTLPYEEWLREAKLVFISKIVGCACDEYAEDEILVMNRILPSLFVPEYQISYIIPPVEPVKERSETHSARLNFKVAKHDILYDYQNNAQVLNEVQKIISEVKDDPNLTITELHITGYASPEGNYYSNYKLSENRAMAFAEYLRRRFNIGYDILTVDWVGEDWRGLHKAVEESNIMDRDHVLWLIDGQLDNQTLKSRIQSLSGGTTYRILLEYYYPPLRRNEYTIKYIARAFDLEEAKLLIRTKPHYLSLNEMFLVANSYPKDSQDFKEVFDIAVRLYPDSPIAELNAAALELENGAIHRAIERLNRLDIPEAWNNLGVAYIKLEEYASAEEFFQKAIRLGHTQAEYNLQQMKQWLKEK